MNTNSVRFFNESAAESPSPHASLILAVWEIKNPLNMGQIIRLAHNAGARKVLFISETKSIRESRIKKTAGFSFEQMNWEIIPPSHFFSSFPGEYHLVALETCEGSQNLFRVTLPEKMLLLAGNESHGLPPEVIAQSQKRLFIPMPGGCKSMNVAQALSVTSFEWLRQQGC